MKRQTEHVAPQIFSRTVLARLRAFRNPDRYDQKEAYRLSNFKKKPCISGLFHLDGSVFGRYIKGLACGRLIS